MVSFALRLLLILCVTAEAQKYWLPAEMPNPRLNPIACGAPSNNATWLCDPEHILTTAEYTSLNRKLEDVHQNILMTCNGVEQGYEIAIAVAHRIDRQGQDLDDAVMQFATDVHQKVWRTGVQSCDNGMIIALLISDRHFPFSIGKAVQRKFSDARASIVADRMRPVLANGTYAAGLSVAVDALSQYLRGADEKVGCYEPNQADCDDSNQSGLVVTAVFCTVGGVGIYSVRCIVWQRKRDKGTIQLIDQELGQGGCGLTYQPGNEGDCIPRVGCPIWLQDFGAMATVTLPCWHQFHTQCLTQYRNKHHARQGQPDDDGSQRWCPISESCTSAGSSNLPQRSTAIATGPGDDPPPSTGVPVPVPVPAISDVAFRMERFREMAHQAQVL